MFKNKCVLIQTFCLRLITYGYMLFCYKNVFLKMYYKIMCFLKSIKILIQTNFVYCHVVLGVPGK
jgi:hypothetical protein